MYRIQYRPHGETWQRFPSTYSKKFTLHMYSPRFAFTYFKAATACIEEMIKEPEWMNLKSELRIINEGDDTVAWEYASGSAVAGPYFIQIKQPGGMWRGADAFHKVTYGGCRLQERFLEEATAIGCADAFSENWPTYGVRVINKPDSRVVWEKGKQEEGQHMDNYWKIEKKNLDTWRFLNTDKQYDNMRINGTFRDPENAVKVIKLRRQVAAYRTEHLRVIKSGVVFYDSQIGYMLPTTTSYELSCELTTQPAGGDTDMSEPDLTKPLTLPRTEVVKTLEANLAAEVKKRTDAEEAEKKARQDALDAIAQFTPDELYNLFVRLNHTVDPKSLAFEKESKVFVTPELKPTKVESDTEKFVRIMKMATDESIEIIPGQELYRLL